MGVNTFQSAFNKDTLLWVNKGTRFYQKKMAYILYGFCLRYVKTYFVFQEYLNGTACLLAKIAEASLSSVNTYFIFIYRHGLTLTDMFTHFLAAHIIISQFANLLSCLTHFPPCRIIVSKCDQILAILGW